MIFIPPPVQTQLVTRHSRELGKQVEQLVRDYRRGNPDLTDAEIRAALTQSMGTSDTPGASFRRRKTAVLASVLAAGIGAAFVSIAGAGGVVSSGLLWKVIGGTVAVAAVAIAAIRLMNQD